MTHQLLDGYILTRKEKCFTIIWNLPDPVVDKLSIFISFWCFLFFFQISSEKLMLHFFQLFECIIIELKGIENDEDKNLSLRSECGRRKEIFWLNIFILSSTLGGKTRCQHVNKRLQTINVSLNCIFTRDLAVVVSVSPFNIFRVFHLFPCLKHLNCC